eukprot:3429558-Pyramimonas_sp.AAC.1
MLLGRRPAEQPAAACNPTGADAAPSGRDATPNARGRGAVAGGDKDERLPRASGGGQPIVSRAQQANGRL